MHSANRLRSKNKTTETMKKTTKIEKLTHQLKILDASLKIYRAQALELCEQKYRTPTNATFRAITIVQDNLVKNMHDIVIERDNIKKAVKK